jgi:hypothetical protein
MPDHMKNNRLHNEKVKMMEKTNKKNPINPRNWAPEVRYPVSILLSRIIFRFSGEGNKKSISGSEKINVSLVVACMILTQTMKVRKEKMMGFTVSDV